MSHAGRCRVRGDCGCSHDTVDTHAQVNFAVADYRRVQLHEQSLYRMGSPEPMVKTLLPMVT